jgi:tetratricopeptide (TPR) repeat protein
VRSRSQPDREDVLQNLSTLHLAEGRPREALPLLERLCALRPDLAPAQGNRIAALLALGERERAAELARTVAPRFPGDPKMQAIAREALRGAR